jgi:hypothetical protein
MDGASGQLYDPAYLRLLEVFLISTEQQYLGSWKDKYLIAV